MSLSNEHATRRLPYFDYFQRDGRVHDLPSTTRKVLGSGAYQALWSAYRWLKHEFKAPPAPRSTPRLTLWRRGFFAESAAIYDFPSNDPRDYLSDFQQIHLGGWINHWDGLFNHKMGLRAFLRAKGLRQPETVAFIYEGRILVDPFSGLARYVSPEELQLRLRAEGDGAAWVVKPEDGRQGQGLFLLEHSGDAFTARRGQESAPIDLRTFVTSLQPSHNGGQAGATLIERRLEQGPFWRGLFPDTANTLRLLTLWSPDEPTPFIARAVQRIGAADTVPTDNWSAGGISAPVDCATGRLGPGRMHPLKGRARPGATCVERLAPFERHPQTGAPITGAVLPGWDRVTDVVLRAAGSLPFNRIGGWDVLVEADGTPIILEANGNSDVNLLQVHGGLLAEPRIRHFYQAFGVVS